MTGPPENAASTERIRILAGPKPERYLRDWQPQPGRDLWISRTQLRRRYLESGALHRRQFGDSEGAASNGGVLIESPYTTLDEWVARLYDRTPGRRPIVGRAEQLRLLQRLLEAEGKKPENPFRGADRRHGLVDRARQLIANIKQELPAPQTGKLGPPGSLLDIDTATKQAGRLLARMDRVQGDLAPRLRVPVLNLFAAYLNEMRGLGLADQEDAFLAVCENDLGALPSFDRIIWEGWYLPNAVQLRLMRRLAEKAAESVVLLDGVFNEEAEKVEPTVFDSVFARSLDFWRELGGDIEWTAPDGAEVGRITALQAFHEEQALSEQEGRALLRGVNTSELSTAPWRVGKFLSGDEELRWIARKIRSLQNASAKSGAQKPAGIAVVFPTLESRSDHIDETFGAYGIRFRQVDRTPLSRTAPARLLAELFDLVRLRFPRREVFGFLTSPLIHIDWQIDEPITHAELLEFDLLLRESRFSGGRCAAAWEKHFATLEERFEKQANRADEKLEAAGDIEADSAKEAAELEDDPDRLNWQREKREAERRLSLLNRVGPPVLGQLFDWEEIAERREALDLAEGWIEAYKSLGVLKGLRPISATGDGSERLLPRHIVERDLRAWEGTTAVMAEIGRLLALAENGEATHELYEREVRAALEAEEITLLESDDPRDALVLSRLDMRLLDVDVLFLAGFNAGEVPGRQNVHIFFSEEERRAIGWRTQQEVHDEWLHLLGTGLMRGREVYISWSGGSDEGIGSQSSFLLERLARTCGFDLESLSPTPSRAEGEPVLASRERLENWEGEEGNPVETLELNRSEAQNFPEGIGHLFQTRSSNRRIAWQNRAVRDREHRPARSPFDGRLEFERFERLPGSNMPKRAGGLSATALEAYAQCAFKSWAKRLLMLKPLPEWQPVPERHEIGLVIHEALSRLFSEIEKDLKKKERRRAPDAWAEEFAERGPRLAELVEEEAAFLTAEVDPFWDSEVARWCAGLREPSAGEEGIFTPDGTLAKLLELQRDSLSALLPVNWEAGIGSRQGREILTRGEVQVKAGSGAGERSIAVRGVLDRLDEWSPEDEGENTPGLILFDYKTGNLPRADEIEDGIRFQLPLYLSALEKVLAEEDPTAAIYIGLKGDDVEVSGFAEEDFLQAVDDFGGRAGARRGSEKIRRFDSGGEEGGATIREYLAQSLEMAAAALRCSGDGQFATGWIGEKKMGCSYCDFSDSCRVDHEGKLLWRLRSDKAESDQRSIYLPKSFEKG